MGNPNKMLWPITDSVPTRGGVTIGKLILREAVSPDKIWMEQDSGEGGEFSAAAVEAVLQAFYADNF